MSEVHPVGAAAASSEATVYPSRGRDPTRACASFPASGIVLIRTVWGNATIEEIEGGDS